MVLLECCDWPIDQLRRKNLANVLKKQLIADLIPVWLEVFAKCLTPTGGAWFLKM
jgi:hypothetical protein